VRKLATINGRPLLIETPFIEFIASPDFLLSWMLECQTSIVACTSAIF